MFFSLACFLSFLFSCFLAFLLSCFLACLLSCFLASCFLAFLLVYFLSVCSWEFHWMFAWYCCFDGCIRCRLFLLNSFLFFRWFCLSPFLTTCLLSRSCFSSFHFFSLCLFLSVVLLLFHFLFILLSLCVWSNHECYNVTRTYIACAVVVIFVAIVAVGIACERMSAIGIMNVGRRCCGSFDTRTQNGKTALMHATQWEHTDCVRLLLNAGADIEVNDDVREKCFFFCCSFLFGDL